MSALALLGAPHRNENRANLTGADHLTQPARAESRTPSDIWAEFAMSLGFKERRARQLVRYFIEQAQTDWDFAAWITTYADPTGETATLRVLRAQAKEGKNS